MSLPKKIVLVVISMALLAGAWCSLMYFGVLAPPAFIKKIPLADRLLGSSKTTVEQLSPEEEEKRRLLAKIKSLEEEKTALERELQAKDTELRKVKSDLASATGQLEELKKATMTAKGQDDVFKELARYYSSIKPKEAALVFEQLDDETVIGILQHMDSEQVGKIMAAISPERAAVITKKMLEVTASGET